VDVPSLRRRLLAANVVGGHPKVLSPDGKTVAYTLDDNGKPGVYLVGIDGNSRRHLFDGGSGSPTWSPDSKRLAIVKDLNSVVIIGADGKGVHRVSLGGSRLNTVMSIAWGPAVTSLLVETLDSATFADRIELVGLDGHVLHTLTSTAFPSFTAAWSPRGTQIAFVERRGAKQYVVVVHADGSGRHTIESIDTETSQISLAWSPDGHSVVTANKSRVRVVQADGTRARTVANAAANATLDDPAWQPRP
jgi:Tol biopolymer transport system component